MRQQYTCETLPLKIYVRENLLAAMSTKKNNDASGAGGGLSVKDILPQSMAFYIA